MYARDWCQEHNPEEESVLRVEDPEYFVANSPVGAVKGRLSRRDLVLRGEGSALFRLGAICRLLYVAEQYSRRERRGRYDYKPVDHYTDFGW